MLKRIILLISLVMAASTGLGAQDIHGIKELTDETFMEYAKDKPALFLILTTRCELGEIRVESIGSKLSCFDIAVCAFMYSDRAQGISSGFPSSTTHIYFVSYGKYWEGHEGNECDNDILRWANQIIKKYNLPGADDDYETEERGTAKIIEGPVRLSDGLRAWYEFDGNGKDSTGNYKDLKTNESCASLKDGTLCMNGEYRGNSTKAEILVDDMKFDGDYTMALNFYNNKNKSIWGSDYNLLFTYRSQSVTVAVTSHKLIIWFYLLPFAGSYYYCLEDTDIAYNVWNHLIISMDSAAKRIYIYLNGERLNDIILADYISSAVKGYMSGDIIDYPGTDVPLGREISFIGNGGNANGYLDDFMIWDRVLNNDEAEELYAAKKKNNAAGPGETSIWAGVWNAEMNSYPYTIPLKKVDGYLTGHFGDGYMIMGVESKENNKPVLNGIWTHSDGIRGPGWFRFELSDDKKSFTGSWGFMGYQNDIRGPWNGNKQ